MNTNIRFVVSGRLHLMALVVSLLVGCSATGATFAERQPPPGKSLVYVYRNGGMLGAAGSWEFYENDQYITKITNGGYYDFVVDPGHIQFAVLSGYGPMVMDVALISHLMGKSPLLTLEANADETYYFKFEIGSKMSPVTKEEAVHDMIGKHRFNDP
jgi:hypothetical protein